MTYFGLKYKSNAIFKKNARNVIQHSLCEKTDFLNFQRITLKGLQGFKWVGSG